MKGNLRTEREDMIRNRDAHGGDSLWNSRLSADLQSLFFCEEYYK